MRQVKRSPPQVSERLHSRSAAEGGDVAAIDALCAHAAQRGDRWRGTQRGGQGGWAEPSPFQHRRPTVRSTSLISPPEGVPNGSAEERAGSAATRGVDARESRGLTVGGTGWLSAYARSLRETSPAEDDDAHPPGGEFAGIRGEFTRDGGEFSAYSCPGAAVLATRPAASARRTSEEATGVASVAEAALTVLMTGELPVSGMSAKVGSAPPDPLQDLRSESLIVLWHCPTLYTSASYGTWISPRNLYIAHGACSWQSWVFTTLGTPRFGCLCPSCTVQHTLKMPLVFFTFSRVLRLTGVYT
eukprot:1179716-Prorocentrum_minimum.AAC.1